MGLTKKRSCSKGIVSNFLSGIFNKSLGEDVARCIMLVPGQFYLTRKILTLDPLGMAFF